MIETIVRNYLLPLLPCEVYLEVPSSPPAQFICIEKVGSSDTDHLCNATIAVQSCAASMLEAAKMNVSVKKVMQDLPVLDVIAKVTLNSDYNFTDVRQKRYRYQAVFDIKYFDEI